MNDTELLIPVEEKPLTVAFVTGEGLLEMIGQVEQIVDSAEFNMETATGRKGPASLAYSIARVQSACEEIGKRFVADRKAEIANIDKNRKYLRDRLIECKTKAREPLTQWEAVEQARLDGIQQRMDNIKEWSRLTDLEGNLLTLESLASNGENLASIDINEQDFGERQKEAEELLLVSKRAVDGAIVAAKAAEEAQRKAEEEEAKRLEAERLERERTEKARLQAEAEEAKRLEAERKRLAAEEAKRQAELEKQRQALEEAQRKADAEKAKRLEAERREQQRIKEARRQAEAIEREKQAAAEAAQRERDRIDAEKQRKEAKERRRQQDKEHRRLINREIMEDLEGINPDMPETVWQQIITAMAKGHIRHVIIKY